MRSVVWIVALSACSSSDAETQQPVDAKPCACSSLGSGYENRCEIGFGPSLGVACRPGGLATLDINGTWTYAQHWVSSDSNGVMKDETSEEVRTVLRTGDGPCSVGISYTATSKIDPDAYVDDTAATMYMSHTTHRTDSYVLCVRDFDGVLFFRHEWTLTLTGNGPQWTNGYDEGVFTR